jgi:hypothetical protein
VACLAFPSPAFFAVLGQETGMESVVGSFCGAATVNATLNLLTVVLILYVTKITRGLDKEVRDGGE